MNVTSMRHSNKAWCSMISEIEKNLGIFIRLKDFLARISTIMSATSQDIVHIVWCTLFVTIINCNIAINVDSRCAFRCWVIKYFIMIGFKWLPLMGTNIIEGEENNLVFRDTIFDHDLVGMEDIRLVAVISITLRPGYQDGPVVRCSG